MDVQSNQAVELFQMISRISLYELWTLVFFIVLYPFIIAGVKSYINKTLSYIKFKKKPFADKYRNVYFDGRLGTIIDITYQDIIIEFSDRIIYVDIDQWKNHTWECPKCDFSKKSDDSRLL